MKMFNVSNSLSLLRAPLAFLFLSESPTLRTVAVLLAMITDCVDGYLARKFRSSSKFGAFLDPLMDKFFVFFAVSVFLLEGRVELWQALLLVSRDFAITIFVLYLTLRGKWKMYQLRSILWGKVTTAMQFFILIALSMRFTPPTNVYWSFFGVGILVFAELMKSAKETTPTNF